VDELIAMVKELQEADGLTDWEDDFVAQMGTKVARFRDDLHFSAGQEAKIRQIYKDRC
jgi:hypothetical protein